MKNIIIIALSFVSMGALAQTLVLGEHKGTGSVEDVLTQSSGAITYKHACDVAFNIVNTGKRVGIEYSYYQCGGYAVWNDLVLIFDVVDNKIMKNGKEIGEVSSDGSFVFAYAWSRTESRQVAHLDEHCRVISIESKVFVLNGKLIFSAKVQSANSYLVQRTLTNEMVVGVPLKDVPLCSTRTDYEKAQEKSEITAVVVK